MPAITPENVHKILGDHILADGFDLVLDLRKSRGCRMYDAKRQKWFLDFFSFFASSPVGFNHPEMANPDFIRKIGEVAVNKPSNSDIYTIEMADFVQTFAKIAKPDSMKYLFFISGGALAVENAFKTAMDWKVRKNQAKGIQGEKGYKIIHFKQSFHGRAGYTLSVTNTYDQRKTKYFPKFDWPRIMNPKLTFPLNEAHIEKVIKLEHQAYQEIEAAISADVDDICAIVIEPIQGEGGDNHFRPEFFQKLRTICDSHELLFIVDEIQTGIGITGKMWAYQHYGFEPDIIVFGKKTQICGIMVSDRIDEVDNHVFKESSRINSTFGGNIVDMVRSQKFLEIIEQEKLVEKAAQTGSYLIQQLYDLGSRHKNLISNIRGRGLMCSFDLPDADLRGRLIQAIYEKNMLILPCGRASLRFRPPLNIGKDDIDAGIEIIEKSLKAVCG